MKGFSIEAVSLNFFVFLLLALGGVVPCLSAQTISEEAPTKDDNNLLRLSIEELMEIEIDTVYGASKFEQKVTQAPSSVTVITADDIKKLGYRTFSEILESLRGVHTSNDRNYTYTGVRGFGRPADYDTRILVLVDGVRVNDPVYQGGSSSYGFVIDVDLIEKLEFVRGPSSSLYGTNAFFGVVNVITREASQIDGFEVSAEIAKYDRYQERVTYGKKFENDMELTLSATWNDSNGVPRLYYKDFDDVETNNGWAEYIDSERSRSFFSRLVYKGFTFEGAFVFRDKQVPTASYETIFNDPNLYTSDDNGFLNLKYEDKICDKTTIQSRLYYTRYRYEGVYPYDYAEEEDEEPFYVLNQDKSEGDLWGGEVQVVTDQLAEHRLTLGGEFKDNFNLMQNNYDEDPYELYVDSDRSNFDWAIFAQDEYQFFDELILHAGIRYDQYESFGDTLNPRLALIYQIAEDSTLKLLYGEAFRAPSVYEMYYADVESLKANPNLEPEEIKSYEVVFEHYFNKNLSGSLSGYFNEINDLISQVVDSEDEMLWYQNVNEVEARGVEAELLAKWPSGWKGRLSYAFQETEDQITKRTLSNSPQHLGKFSLIAPLYGQKIFSGFELLYTGSRETLKANKANARLLANLNIYTKDLVKDCELSLGIYNLFDEDYSDPGSGEHVQDLIARNGRVYRAKLTYRFDIS